MAEKLGITVENVFEPSTVRIIMRADQRLKSLALVDSHRILKETYRKILDALAKNSDPEYGPRMTPEEMTDEIKPVRLEKYREYNINAYCMDLQRADVLRRARSKIDGSTTWTYVIPFEMLPKECQNISSMQKEGFKLEEIADRIDIEENMLERAVEVLKYQLHFS